MRDSEGEKPRAFVTPALPNADVSNIGLASGQRVSPLALGGQTSGEGRTCSCLSVLSASLPLCLSASLSFCLSVSLSLSRFLFLSLSLSLSLSICFCLLL